MTNALRALAVLLIILSQSSFPGADSTARAAKCRFVLGFSALHDLIPDIVGDCKVDQHYNPQNGDALQETTGGLLAWRKADNFTAFTDGHSTWINGPQGLQQRLNTERFDWEAPGPTQAAAQACAVSDKDVTFGQFVGDHDGSAVGQGSVRNPCDYALDAIIDVFARVSKDGPVIVDAPSLFIRNLAPGESKAITARVPSRFAATWFTWKLVNVSTQVLASAEDCSGPKSGQCLFADRWLISAIDEIEGVQEGKWLLDVAAENVVRIRRGATQTSTLANYSFSSKTITIDSGLDAYSSWVRAAVLSHELQHAADDASHQLKETSADCYRAEESAFRRQAQVWRDLWQNQLPSGIDDLHRELNGIVLSMDRDAAAFARSLVPRYANQCKD
ncbi:MAG: hypothetical protein Q8R28_03595 [Dehalococcoidia bacterium]|nr:hypothetical protein [Dehalococcoidia bacterium]